MITRRDLLGRCAGGFGAVAFASLFGASLSAATDRARPSAPHHPPRARRIIYLYMDGGPSQVDSLDYKPLLEEYHGQDPRKVIGKLEKTQFANVGTVYQSPWKFRRYGQCGRQVSDLFPHIAQQADDLCVIRSMTSKFPEHTSANFFLHTGIGLQGRPSMGAWITYGLGSVNDELPGYVIVNGGLIPAGGVDNFASGFLPAKFQGSLFQAGQPAIANITPPETDPRLQQTKRNLIRKLDRGLTDVYGADDQIESAIANAELAANMQTAVPALTDITGESEATKSLYGLDDPNPHTQNYGRQCLLARRLVERGVRFVELTCPPIFGYVRWDAHSGLHHNHTENAKAVDKPIAGLLRDLKQRGLLDDTLVVWSGEFGRTPFAQGGDGRDHNEFGFSLWLAGGGVKPGIAYGATDEWGYKAVENRLEIHDLHATMLHLLGIDHLQLTYRFSGRDIRLTDVYGKVIHDVLA